MLKITGVIVMKHVHFMIRAEHIRRDEACYGAHFVSIINPRPRAVLRIIDCLSHVFDC